MTATLKLSENLVRFRKEKKITQEGLAEFIGVTKASVSKWETGQSLPDILILPQLAVYFDVTVDELLGYEPQLDRSQIKMLYAQLAAEYAGEPFEEVTEKTRSLVHRYYSCYPFLTQIAVLWLNHFTLAGEQEQRQKLLEEGSALCSHVIENCREIAVCNDAVALKTLFDLNLGRAEEVIAQLEEITDPVHASQQMDMTLIKAYLTAGKRDCAYSYTQITIYTHMIALVSAASLYLNLSVENREIYEETIARTEGIIRLFDLDTLHPNVTAGFYYQCAVGYMAQKEKEKALKKLRAYGRAVLCVLEQAELHGDSYFDRLEEWIERLDLGGMPPRSMKRKKRRIKGFSRGMKQRLGIAQALFNRPKLLICDEPTSALDPVGRKEILDILRSVKEETTVLFSTHILSDVERICDHAAFLHEGKIVLEGTMKELENIHGEAGYEIEPEYGKDTESLGLFLLEQGLKMEKDDRIICGTRGQAEAVLGYLLAHQIPIRRMEKRETDLEALFLEVTGRKEAGGR